MDTGRLKMKQRTHSWCNSWCFIFIFALSYSIVCVTGSGNHASIKSKYGQLVTSSTLRWRHIMGGHGKNRIPIGAVPSGTGNPSRVVCRAEHHGTLLVGQTTLPDERCAVGFVNKIHRKQKYEVLINQDRAARLEWRSYNKFAGVPVGAVAAVDENSEPASGNDNVFIGRHLGTSGSWRPGAVEVPRRSSYSAFGVMRVFDPTESLKGAVMAEEHSSGDILVEVEPVRYELDIHDSSSDKMFKNRPKTTKDHAILTKSSLFRFDEGRDAEARLQKVLSYAYDKSEYYGQIPGMIRALQTTIRLSNGETQSVLWGMPENSKQRETMMVGHKLKHHTAVDISIVADKITVESPYRATLTSIFPDGTRRQRKKIEGVLQRKYLNNIRPDYSRVYEIKQLKVKAKEYNEDDLDMKRKKDDKHTHTHVHKNNLDHNHNDNYIVPDWDNNNINDNQKTKNNQMLSDQMTQKSFTSEKEKELPLVFKGNSNSAQKQLHVSNFLVYILTFFSIVLSVNLSRNYDNVYSSALR